MEGLRAPRHRKCRWSIVPITRSPAAQECTLHAAAVQMLLVDGPVTGHNSAMKIAIVTAGAATMFCGSCMQDNTLVRALRSAGHDVTLVPTYTPIRVDEDDVSYDRVFLGGVNVYLDSAVPGWSRLPRWLTGWLDRPGVLQVLTRRSSSTDGSKLGWLAIDMLKGEQGPQRKDIRQLVTWLAADLQPDLILFSNALLSGIVPSLRRRFDGPIACLLQGDDIFLDALPERWKGKAIDLVRDNSQHFDGLLTHSSWYADYLSNRIGLPRDRFHRIPLTIDTDLPESAHRGSSQIKTIGYFARVCPEKGINNFLDAAERILPKAPSLQFLAAGYLPDLHAGWFHRRLNEAQALVGSESLQWLGSPLRREDKFRILRTYDLLCVPTNYREPKGIFVLEAALAGVPSLVPHHGAFPELIAGLGYGETYKPESSESLAVAIQEILERPPTDVESTRIKDAVCRQHGMEATSVIISGVLESLRRRE